MPQAIVYATVSISWGLMILIWMVQLIVYPGFFRISDRTFNSYHRWYTLRITVIVAPLMLSEVLCVIGWLVHDMSLKSILLILLPVVIVWLSTFTLQVPIHSRLQKQVSRKLVRKLVLTNWIRTAAWSVKALGVWLVV